MAREVRFELSAWNVIFWKMVMAVVFFEITFYEELAQFVRKFPVFRSCTGEQNRKS